MNANFILAPQDRASALPLQHRAALIFEIAVYDEEVESTMC